MKSRRHIGWARILVVAAMACSSTAGIENGDLTLAGGGTVAGLVSIGPICPVEQQGVPCPVPPEVYVGVHVVVRDGDGDLAARVGLDGEGRYRVDLPAGRYQVTLDHELGIERGHSPTYTVEIRRHQTTIVDFEIDTGIR